MNTLTNPAPAANGAAGQNRAMNTELGSLLRSSYTLQEVDHIWRRLVENNTVRLRRYSSGGHSAVTVLNDRTFESAVDGLLVFHWDRDNIMQSLAELKLALTPALNDILGIAGDAWKKGLMASIIHHKKRDVRFMDIIQDRASGMPHDYMRRPHIRYNPISLEEVGDPWGHGQNDSLSFVNFMLFHGLNSGKISLDDPAISDAARSFACMVHALFWKVHVWEDRDLGAWEDCVGIHWSSVACALISFREQLTYVSQHGSLVYHKDGAELRVDEKGVRELIEKCEARLRELGTREFAAIDGDPGREADLAQINPLLLAAFTGKPILDDANTVAVLESVERVLEMPMGCRRYLRDRWDGRVNRDDLALGEEAQWCHGSPQMSYIWGELYQRTGDERFFQKQLYHFNRGLAAITERWTVPEAWIVDPVTRKWVPDANEPLAWAQSMVVLSVAQMRASVARHLAASQN